MTLLNTTEVCKIEIENYAAEDDLQNETFDLIYQVRCFSGFRLEFLRLEYLGNSHGQSNHHRLSQQEYPQAFESNNNRRSVYSVVFSVHPDMLIVVPKLVDIVD